MFDLNKNGTNEHKPDIKNRSGKIFCDTKISQVQVSGEGNVNQRIPVRFQTFTSTGRFKKLRFPIVSTFRSF